MTWNRYCVSATAIKGMATHPHAEDSPPSLLRDRYNICADRRSAPVRQLEGARDHH